MASFINMSLEDIIQRKKKTIKGYKPQVLKAKHKNFKETVPIMDARNKIIMKKRTQITDAREKLVELAKQKDARLKLEQLRMKRHTLLQGQGRNIFQKQGKVIRNIPLKDKERVFADCSRQVVAQPLSNSNARANKYSTRHQFDRNVSEKHSVQTRVKGKPPSVQPKPPSVQPLYRTVENDIKVIDDPMGDELIVPTTNSLNRKASLQLKIVAHNNDTHGRRTAIVSRSSLLAREKSPPRPPSILKKRSMAAFRSDQQVEKVDKPSFEYRIIVSNLRNSVTGGDIQELFGDIGGMVESRLVRPGTAEVIYKTQDDAQKAVDLYHNRQLDGQPMNCLLVTPRATIDPAKSNKSSLYSTNSNVEPDISTFHKVLFSNY